MRTIGVPDPRMALDALCVASVGNHGMETLTYPAALRSVMGIAAVDPLGQPSVFTNYGGSLVKVGRARRAVEHRSG
jgi:hypothetical protein